MPKIPDTQRKEFQQNLKNYEAWVRERLEEAFIEGGSILTDTDAANANRYIDKEVERRLEKYIEEWNYERTPQKPIPKNELIERQLSPYGADPPPIQNWDFPHEQRISYGAMNMPGPMTAPVPPMRPDMVGAQNPLANMDPMTLAAILGSVRVPEQQRPPMPQTTFPEVPRAMNPGFSQLVMQAMQQRPQAQTGTLGALLRGIGG